jgi:hypothetical protein
MVNLWRLFPHLRRHPPPRPPLLCQVRLQRSAPALRLENENKMAVTEVTTRGSSPSVRRIRPHVLKVRTGLALEQYRATRLRAGQFQWPAH